MSITSYLAFIATTQDLLSKYSVVASLMIVKRDGHLMRAELAVKPPIETVLRGPAASFPGAHHLSRGGGSYSS